MPDACKKQEMPQEGWNSEQEGGEEDSGLGR